MLSDHLSNAVFPNPIDHVRSAVGQRVRFLRVTSVVVWKCLLC